MGISQVIIYYKGLSDQTPTWQKKTHGSINNNSKQQH
jgi:hypothetical protein